MDISYLGHSSFRIKGKGAVLVTDPFDSDYTGLKFPKTETDIITVSHDHKDHNDLSKIEGTPLVISGPGEYECKKVRIAGIDSFHDSQKGAKRGRNTIYRINIDGIIVVHLGDLGHLLSDEQQEQLGDIDVLLIPVGGVYTIDANDAVKTITLLEPKIVIPMHYQVAGLKFDLESLDKFTKSMGCERIDPLPKLKLNKESLPVKMEVVVLKSS